MRPSPAIFLLPCVALIGAFTLGPVNAAISQTVQTLFLPVAWPTRLVGAQVKEHLAPQASDDLLSPGSPRTVADLRRQNAELIVRLTNIEAQLEDLKKLSAQYATLGGDLRKMVQPATVIGGPTDQRQVLTIGTATLTRVADNAAVVHPLGFVGRVSGVAIAGGNARVLLATDPSSRVSGRFVRFVPRPDGAIDIITLDLPPPLVEGTTRGLIARLLPARPIREKLKVADMVLLDDPQLFPIPALKGLRIGSVTKIRLPPTDAGHAEVEIAPITDFSSLREVLVVTK
ncbi:MAG: hypothetical protein H7144_12440 [Burkholderiales bacterium]|nr:hypothetical protein [Phycisphaerae bacterium]